MPTCRSWRYNSASGDVTTPPGKDRNVWSLCHNKVPRGVRRCEECLNALLFHPNEQIRASLANEKTVSRSTLEYLAASDPSMVVIATAEEALAKLDKSPRRNQRAAAEIPASTKRKDKERKSGSALWGGENETVGLEANSEPVDGAEPEVILPRTDAFDTVLGQPELQKRSRKRE